MSRKKDTVELVRLAERQGWTVEYTGGGHWRFKSPNGPVVFTPSTPGGSRSWQNSIAKLRRAGLAVPKKGG